MESRRSWNIEFWFRTDQKIHWSTFSQETGSSKIKPLLYDGQTSFVTYKMQFKATGEANNQNDRDKPSALVRGPGLDLLQFCGQQSRTQREKYFQQLIRAQVRACKQHVKGLMLRRGNSNKKFYRWLEERHWRCCWPPTRRSGRLWKSRQHTRHQLSIGTTARYVEHGSHKVTRSRKVIRWKRSCTTKGVYKRLEIQLTRNL